MKKIFLFYIFFAGVVFPQAIYEVQPNSKGNTIILSIVNESRVENAGSINVILSNEPRSLEIKNCVVQLDDLKKGEEKETQFVFDVNRIPSAIKDTLHFRITDQNGDIWMKEIILSYALPTEFKLAQNYPNPFNPSTTIEFTVPNVETGHVPSLRKITLKIYDMLGREVKTILDGEMEAGYHQVTFNAGEFASGVYLYALKGEGINIVKKMILLK